MQTESDFLIKWCWQRGLGLHPQMPMKSIPIATLSYSNYPLPHNNQLWVSQKTDHFIIFPVQRIRLLGKVQQRYLLRELSGEDSVLGWQQLGPDSEKKGTPSLTPVIWDCFRTLAKSTHTASPKQTLCFFTAWRLVQRQVSQDSPYLRQCKKMGSHCHRNKYKTGQP